MINILFSLVGKVAQYPFNHIFVKLPFRLNATIYKRLMILLTFCTENYSAARKIANEHRSRRYEFRASFAKDRLSHFLVFLAKLPRAY